MKAYLHTTPVPTDTMLPGSEQAFTLFYKEHAAKFFYYCTRFIDNDDEAKAIVDEQFARMWEKRTKFKTVNDLRAYMYASLRNACFRYLKVAKEGADPNSPAVEALAVEESIDHQMVRTELMNALYERIQQLSPQKREVMELLYFQDMTIAQAAEKMGISEEAVRQNKHRALTELRHKAITDKLLLLCLFLLR